MMTNTFTQRTGQLSTQYPAVHLTEIVPRHTSAGRAKKKVHLKSFLVSNY